MKVLLYSLNYAPEPVGIGKYSGELGQWLASRGHQVRVITAQPYFPAWQIPPGHPNRYAIEQRDGVSIRRCPLWVPRRPSGLTRLLHLASFALTSLGPVIAQRSSRPDVVITVAPAFFGAPAALLLTRLCGPTTVSWLHVQDFELDAAFELGLLKGRLLRALAERWERSTLRGFRVASSISQAMVQRLIAKGVSPQRTALLPNWVDLAAIRPASAAQRIANPYRRQLAISPDQIVLMYSGSMNAKQGLDLLAEVIHHLADLPQLVWLLAGEGPTKAELMAATTGLPHVHHLPLQPAERLNDWLGAADIHLLPQKAAAADLVLPSKLLGILASGRPVVASSPAGSELALLSDQAGLCVPPGDAAAFAQAIRQLVLDPALRMAKGTAARRIAEQRYGREAVLEAFESRLKALVAAADTPAGGR